MSLPRVLVVGATGAFGERLAIGLARSRFPLVLVARGGGRLDALAGVLRSMGAEVATLALDRAALDGARLQALKAASPDLFAVVDAAGPFQGAAPTVPRAAIAARLHCIDLADARDYVGATSNLDDEARRAGVAVLSGASSTPALSHAVLDVLTRDAVEIHAIDVAICPGNRAPRGPSVVRAILSYVGRPVQVFREGAWEMRPAWGRPERLTLKGLGARWVSLCDTADLDLLVERYRPRTDATFRAGLELPLMHWSLSALGLLVRAGLVRSLRGAAAPLRTLAETLRPFGTDRGGMQVEAVMRERDGLLRRRVWTLVANGGDGPYVPTLPALAAAKMLASGELTFRGAAPAAGLIPYGAIETELAPFHIATSVDSEVCEPLFRRLLGNRFDALPRILQDAHEVAHAVVLEGRADVREPGNGLARLVARAFHLPRPGRDQPVRVVMRRHPDGSETWERRYRDSTMRSRLSDVGAGLLEERFGPLAARLAVQADDRALTLEVVDARIAGIPLPRLLCPVSRAREWVDAEGRFCFDVPIVLPLLGRLAHYSGWLAPGPAKAAERRPACDPAAAA